MRVGRGSVQSSDGVPCCGCPLPTHGMRARAGPLVAGHRGSGGLLRKPPWHPWSPSPHTFATWMVCCSMASWITARSTSLRVALNIFDSGNILNCARLINFSAVHLPARCKHVQGVGDAPVTPPLSGPEPLASHACTHVRWAQGAPTHERTPALATAIICVAGRQQAVAAPLGPLTPPPNSAAAAAALTECNRTLPPSSRAAAAALSQRPRTQPPSSAAAAAALTECNRTPPPSSTAAVPALT